MAGFRRACLRGTACVLLAAVAGCAWFRNPPPPPRVASSGRPAAPTATTPVSSDTTTASAAASDTLGTSAAVPETLAVPGTDVAADTTTAEQSPAAGVVASAAQPDTTAGVPVPAAEDSLAEIPPESLTGDDRWELDGEELVAETGSQGQIIRITGPKITHRDLSITAEHGQYQVDGSRAVLTGNVVFADPEIRGESRKATYLRESEVLRAEGDVLIESDTLRAAADEARYDRRGNTLLLIGNVQGWRNDRQMTSHEAEWFRDRNQVEFRGTVIISDEGDDTRITGERVLYNLETDETQVTERPHLVLQSEKNRTYVRGDRLVVEPGGNAYTAGSVRVVRGGVIATSDSAAFLQDQDLAILFGNPTVKDRDGTLTGETLYLNFDEDKELRRVDMHGHAGVRFAPEDSLHLGEVSTVRGDSLNMHFEDGVATRVVVFGQAQSTYRPSPLDESEGAGTNAVEGDTITIVLDEDGVDRMIVDGGAHGVFTFVQPAEGDTVDEGGESADEEAGDSEAVPTPSETPDAPDTMVVEQDVSRTIQTAVPSKQKVIYSAHQVVYSLGEKTVDFAGEVKLDYATLTLTAGKARFYAERRYLEAENNPVLLDREGGGPGREVVGERMDYNLDSREGTIDDGRTKAEDGFIYSDRLRQIGEGEFISKNGNFTTCDNVEHDRAPHFHFTSNRMRIYLNDKVIAKPVTLYIRDIPIIGLPFYVFSVGKGRRSGFLTPDFSFGLGGTSPLFRNLGYYWAATEYYDFNLATGYRDSPSRFDATLLTNYKKRYLMDGSLRVSTAVETDGNSKEIVGAHRMTLGDWQVTGRANFRDAQFRTNAALDSDFGTRLDRILTSDLSLRRGAFSMTVNRRQDLAADPNDGNDVTVLTETLPSYSFSLNSLFVGRKPDANGEGGRLPFLSNLRLTFNTSGSSTRTKTEHTVITEIDSVTADTTFSFIKERNSQARHTLNVSDTRRILGAMNLTPGLTLTENWVDREFTPTGAVKGFNRAAVWSARLSGNSALYGTFGGLGPVEAIRHTFRPGASLSYQPEFASLSYTDSTGKHNRFPGVSSSERKSLGLNVENAFQAKIRSGEEVRKVDLFRWSLASGYDFVRAERGLRGWSDVSSVFSLPQIYGVALNVNSTHDTYKQFRIKNFNVSGGYSLRGVLPGGDADLPAASVGYGDEQAPPEWQQLGGDLSLRERRQGSSPVSSEALNWNASFSFSYGGSRDFNDILKPTANVTSSLSVQLTKNWSVRYNNHWGVTEGKILAESITLRRDLHCWEAEFTRNRLVGQSAPTFYFRINVKTLPDLKYEQGEGRQTSLSGISSGLLP